MDKELEKYFELEDTREWAKSLGKVGNNGNQLVEVMHNMGLLADGLWPEEIAVIAQDRQLMHNNRHLERDDFWEDVYCRAEELGYKLAM